VAVVNVSVYINGRALYSSLFSENWLLMTEPTPVPNGRAAGYNQAMIKYRRQNANTSINPRLVV
jgi:hypothetical protein